MRIAFIGQKGIPAIYGGIERHVEELSTGLADFGYDVFVYSRPWYVKKSKIEGVNIVNLPSIKTKHLDAISHTLICTIHALFKKYDIIHYHGVGPALLAWIPKIFKPSCKVVVTFHCIDRKHQKWGRLARLSLRLGEWSSNKFADETITVSKVLQQYCSEAYDNETVYIPNGVKVTKTQGSDLIKKKFGLEKDKYILMVSRLVKHKGAHYLIEAFKNLDTDLKLVIAGDSAFTDDYVKSIKELAGDDKRIIFTGFQSGQILEELFYNTLLAVHPSESEGLPIAVLEAMSYGKVVLASDIPENLEVIQDRGISFINKDMEDLKDKLEALIEEPEILKQLGSGIREFVLEKYNWDDIVKDTIKLYKEVLNKEIVKEEYLELSK